MTPISWVIPIKNLFVEKTDYKFNGKPRNNGYFLFVRKHMCLFKFYIYEFIFVV